MLKRTLAEIALRVFGIVASANAFDGASEVESASAKEHLVKKVEPTYPPLAIMA